MGAIREAIAHLPADVSSDAHGVQAPTLEELFAPPSHSAALDPAASVVQGARGAGKSFWAGVLAKRPLRTAAATAYPRLGLDRTEVEFGFTGLPGPEGLDREKLDSILPERTDASSARIFWWATVLRALERACGREKSLRELLPIAEDVEARERLIEHSSRELKNQVLLVVYDALDTVASSWPRRRMLTQALLEVVWAMRAWKTIRPKVFVRPDQLEDDALLFVELPKIRTGAVRLTWSGADLYGLLFSRLALGEARKSFFALLRALGLPTATREEILARRWQLATSEDSQRELMKALAGRYMASGPHGYKKGDTYDWPLKHLADALNEVTPRSFLGLAIGASTFGDPPPNRVFTPDGIRHGLRRASKTRVDQLHQEFPWIKGVLAPLAGLLLPQEEAVVFKAWKRAGTVQRAIKDAAAKGYLPPFARGDDEDEPALFAAMQRIGVMSRRDDGRLDMPDLFRVAAKLLKKGGTAPI
ncbi:hypothetical protein [Anaeromyxobacter paludicola]|uniref:ATP-binding protein n=1 Tax=Anaeromyxobacter paludicola TaxID=2918171 RepID=A0ABM7X958_9BACT|nr:hypothetical protein [Anaeromyxobacter paludicola]BDG08381.1 hypothetical protein AMPC_14940 [Anaeromyxobacter paludicola]